MLKRQRAPSPPLPSSSVPLISDTPCELIERKAKRQRTHPPVLDGASRGWARPPETSFEDEEDYCSDDEVEEKAPSYHSQQESQQHQSEYKSTNTMLRELHTQQQHRICFSPPSTLQNTSLSTHPSHLTISTPIPSRHLSLDKGLLPLQPERVRPAFPSAPMEKGYHDDGIATEETNRITERYEGTNKCVITFGQFFRF